MLEPTHTFRICLAALLSTAMSSAAATPVIVVRVRAQPFVINSIHAQTNRLHRRWRYKTAEQGSRPSRPDEIGRVRRHKVHGWSASACDKKSGIYANIAMRVR